MPMTAEIVDELRRLLGSERVDAAIKAGAQAQREFARIEGAFGLAAANEWLARQSFPHGAFRSVETTPDGEVVFGVLPARRPGCGVQRMKRG